VQPPSHERGGIDGHRAWHRLRSASTSTISCPSIHFVSPPIPWNERNHGVPPPKVNKPILKNTEKSMEQVTLPLQALFRSCVSTACFCLIQIPSLQQRIEHKCGGARWQCPIHQTVPPFETEPENVQMA
jgi:hypothetical protein